MAKISIDIPKNKTLLRVDETTYKIIDKSIKLPESWEEFCKLYPVNSNEYYIDGNSCIIKTRSPRNRDSLFDQKLLLKEQAAGILALIQLIRLRNCYNDSVNGYESNYYINYLQDNFKVDCAINKRPRILRFKTYELAKKFLNNFYNLIEEAKEFI